MTSSRTNPGHYCISRNKTTRQWGSCVAVKQRGESSVLGVHYRSGGIIFPWAKSLPSLSTLSFLQFRVSGTSCQTQWCVRQTYTFKEGFLLPRCLQCGEPPASIITKVDLWYVQIIISLKILSESSNWQDLSRGGITLVEDNKDLKLMGISDSKLSSKWVRPHEPCFASRLLPWLSSASTSSLQQKNPNKHSNIIVTHSDCLQRTQLWQAWEYWICFTILQIDKVLWVKDY